MNYEKRIKQLEEKISALAREIRLRELEVAALKKDLTAGTKDTEPVREPENSETGMTELEARMQRQGPDYDESFQQTLEETAQPREIPVSMNETKSCLECGEEYYLVYSETDKDGNPICPHCWT